MSNQNSNYFYSSGTSTNMPQHLGQVTTDGIYTVTTTSSPWVSTPITNIKGSQYEIQYKLDRLSYDAAEGAGEAVGLVGFLAYGFTKRLLKLCKQAQGEVEVGSVENWTMDGKYDSYKSSYGSSWGTTVNITNAMANSIANDIDDRLVKELSNKDLNNLIN